MSDSLVGPIIGFSRRGTIRQPLQKNENSIKAQLTKMRAETTHARQLRGSCFETLLSLLPIVSFCKLASTAAHNFTEFSRLNRHLPIYCETFRFRAWSIWIPTYFWPSNPTQLADSDPMPPKILCMGFGAYSRPNKVLRVR
jgi:hypothetical protein